MHAASICVQWLIPYVYMCGMSHSTHMHAAYAKGICVYVCNDSHINLKNKCALYSHIWPTHCVREHHICDTYVNCMCGARLEIWCACTIFTHKYVCTILHIACTSIICDTYVNCMCGALRDLISRLARVSGPSHTYEYKVIHTLMSHWCVIWGGYGA